MELKSYLFVAIDFNNFKKKYLLNIEFYYYSKKPLFSDDS